MTDKKLRQAFQAALDMEPIMAAGFGNKDVLPARSGPLLPRAARGTRRSAPSSTTSTTRTRPGSS